MAKEVKKKKVKKLKVKSPFKKGKKGNKKIWQKLMILIMIGLISVSLLGIGFCAYIMIKAPDFEVEKLYKSDSSIILDKDGNVIAELSSESRENVTFDDLPEVLIDAIVAAEDSKFFQHSGIDLMRFAAAVLGQLAGNSNAGGASTLSMQIVKNTYNGTEAHGIAGIIRKFSDVYMAVFKLEKTYTKQEILEFYVNQGYLGSGSYGVENASYTYFGKHVSELNLSEAALIAGLFQAPGAYDPYANPDLAQDRRNTVLNLMVRHGYISYEEAENAKKVNVTDLLRKSNGKGAFQYQDFIDTVVAEVEAKTGYNPYVVSMTIYSTMNKEKQDVINGLYNGTLYQFANDYAQLGIAVTDVEDGSIAAVGAKRNRTGVNQWNYATNIKRHPGSTAKPIFDFGPALEYAGWGTGTTVVDDVYTYSTGQNLYDFDFGYQGIMTAKTALAESRNITALQAFQATSQAQKYEFVTNLGITPELSGDGQIMESASIGAFEGTSPVEMAGAYGAFARGGYYIKPYSFTKIVYNDTNETYTYTPTKSRAMSEETAYMINVMLVYAVTAGINQVGYVYNTDLASKTGTSSVDDTLMEMYNLPASATKDAWMITYSPDYVLSLWYGYDDIRSDYYLTTYEGAGARQYITQLVVPGIFEPNARFTQPKGVVAVDIELETNPVMLASDYTPDNLRSTEYFKKGSEPTEVSYRFKQLENVKNLTYSNVGNQIQLSWDEISEPDAINEEFLQDYFQKGFTRWATKYYQQRLDYNEKNIGILEYEIFLKKNDGTLESLGMTTANNFTTTLTNSTSATYVVKSTYSRFSANASSGTEINVKLTSLVQVPDDEEESENKKTTNNTSTSRNNRQN